MQIGGRLTGKLQAGHRPAVALSRHPASLASEQLNLPYLALGILDLGRVPLDDPVQFIDLLSGAAEGLPMPDHCGLHLLTLGVGEKQRCP